MSLILLNLDSNQQIKLDNQNPLIIGRKNVEGCFDKRVSRNHGRVTCTIDGKLRLEALHFNPCFFTRNGVPPVLQLNKDEEETLSEGDYLGLLPNAFWFKITSDKVTETKIRPDNFQITSTDQASEENIKTGNLHDKRSVTDSEADKTVTIKVKDSSVFNDEVNEGSSNILLVPTSDSVINSTGLSKGFGSEEFEKTRRLPLWMYEIYDPMDSKHSASEGSDKEKKKMSETDRSSRTGIQINGKGPEVNFPSTSDSKTDDELPNTSDVQKGTENNKASRKQGSRRRTICNSGGICSIQTVNHKAKFCHPGDEDYAPQLEQPLFRHSSSCNHNDKRVSESTEYSMAHKSYQSRDETGTLPQPLKRSRKRTKVNTDNENADDGTDDKEGVEASSQDHQKENGKNGKNGKNEKNKEE